MNIYVYQAALLCEGCGLTTKEKLDREGATPSNPGDESTYDSDRYPKGPYASDSNDADTIHHCNHCGLFLENPLTNDGMNQLYEDVRVAINEGKASDALRNWIEFYDLDLKALVDHFCPKT